VQSQWIKEIDQWKRTGGQPAHAKVANRNSAN
jgi:hypothetical protein